MPNMPSSKRDGAKLGMTVWAEEGRQSMKAREDIGVAVGRYVGTAIETLARR